ncbi:MAG: hypothetical protein N3F06_01295 [Nitrososphaerales archaeon]|nr:hypothetical protein [Nitrososphaerales archaeon]
MGLLSIEILSVEENRLLRRKEYVCRFPSAAGLIKRNEAVEALASALKIEKEKVYLIKLSTTSGSRDVIGTFYVYDDEKDAKKHLPRYLFMRMLSKEEREKLKKEKKASK